MGRTVSRSGQINKSRSLINCARERQKDVQAAITALEAFTNDDKLSGAAYENAKGYVQSVLLPVCQSLWGVLDEEAELDKKVIDCCDTHLSGIDLFDEDTLRDEIRRLEDAINSLQSLWMPIGPTVYMTLSYSSRVKTLKRQLEKLDAFDSATRGLHNGANFIVETLLGNIKTISSSKLFTNGRFNWEGIDMRWVLLLTSRWSAYKKKTDGYKQSFIDSLPVELKEHISANDLKVTDDGFMICTKPMEKILEEMGVPEKVEREGKKDPELYSWYDDWYMVGLVKDGKVTYTMVKMREPGDDKRNTGTSVPFISLDVAKFSKAIGDKDYNSMYKETDRIVHQEGNKVNTELRDYFADPKSDGSYLIADCIVEKVANNNFVKNDEGYTWKLTAEYKENDQYAKKRLDELSRLGIYDKENNSIQIKDPKNLTPDEYSAILTATTANTDAYSFAAENQFHAQAQQVADHLQSPGSRIASPGISSLAGDIIEEHAIVSNAGVGESGWGLGYERFFKDPASGLYKEQQKWH